MDFFLFLVFIPIVSLGKSNGNILYRNTGSIQNPHEGVEIDYYFMAKRFGGSEYEITLRLWTVIIDSKGDIFCMYTSHNGHYSTWKEVISDRMKSHLFKVGVDNLHAKRLLRDFEIKKEGYIIPWDYRVGGNRIGIDGSDEIYIRKDRFTYI